MDKGRDNKDETAKEKDNRGNEDNNGESRKVDGALADSSGEEKFQMENNKNEQEDDEYGSQLIHSQVAEIRKSRRSHLDEKSSHIINILEKKRSDAEEDVSRNRRRTLLSTMNEENPKSDEKELFSNPIQERRSLSSTRYMTLNNQSMNEEEEEEEEKEVLGNNNQDALNRKPEENLNKKEESINPENNAFNRQLEENSYESEKERFENKPNEFDSSAESEQVKVFKPSGERSSNYNSRSSRTPRNPYMRGEEEMLVVDPDVRVMDRQPGQSYDKSGEQLNADSDILDRPSEIGKKEFFNPIIERGNRQTTSSITYDQTKNQSVGGYKILDDISNNDLDEESVNTYAEPENDAWNKSQEGLDKGEKEKLFNADEQRGSFRLSNSKSFMPHQDTKNGKEISDSRGYNLNSKKSDDKFINPNKEKVSHYERGSVVKFTDLDINNDEFDEKRASGHHAPKGSDDKTPVKSMCSTPEKIKVIDVITETMKTEKTSPDSADSTRTSPTPVQRKKEVIRINKELAPAVILLLRKLEQCQNKALDNCARELKQHRDPNKDMAEGPEPKKRGSSTDKLKLLDGDRHLGEIGDAKDESVVTIKSSTTTSTSTPEQFYSSNCSSSKCQRTCKRCSEVNRFNQKVDSLRTRKGNSQEDFNIVPTLEALSEKFKNGLKVGCSLLRNFYYNQNLLRVYYFQSHPDGGDTDEEL